MAKRKAVKRKTPTRRPRVEGATDRPTFKERLSLISKAVTELPVTGHSKDGNYWFDRASDVFPIFNALFAKHGILPPRMVAQEKMVSTFGNYPCYEMTCKYVIEDIYSNEQEVIMASGSAFNRDWSLDSAHTWVLKRALKDRFLAGCPQPSGDRTSDETFDLPDSLQTIQQDAQRIKHEGLTGGIADLIAEEAIEEAKKVLDGKTEPEKPKQTEPLEGMTKAGPKQESRIKYILCHFEKQAQAAGVDPQVLDLQAIRNGIWSYGYQDGTTNRWPKNNEEMEEISLNLQY